jgi:hypothetical protein
MEAKQICYRIMIIAYVKLTKRLVLYVHGRRIDQNQTIEHVALQAY